MRQEEFKQVGRFTKNEEAGGETGYSRVSF